MGFAIAEAAAQLGANVTLVSGPVNLTTPENVKRIDIESAEQMHEAVMKNAQSHSIFIACAAVADFKLSQVATQKLK